MVVLNTIKALKQFAYKELQHLALQKASVNLCIPKLLLSLNRINYFLALFQKATYLSAYIVLIEQQQI